MKLIRLYTAALFTALYLLSAPAVTLADEAPAEVAVNINTASAEELAEKLQGIGESRAELIV